MKTFRNWWAVAAIVSLALITTPGWTAESPEKNWEFDLAPLYLWAANISGDVTVKGQTNPVDLEFGDIFDSLEGVFTVHFEGLRQKQWGFIFNLDYLDLGSSADTPLGSAKVDLEDTIAEFDLFHRWHNGPHAFDLLAGVRYNKLDVGVNFERAPLEGGSDGSWVDGVVGGRYMNQFAEKWRLQLRGDLGGGGSDFTWQALGIVDFQPWRYVSILAGYRALGIDYSTGSGLDTFNYDVTMHGPILGLNFTW
jgi:hypothetical protein